MVCLLCTLWFAAKYSDRVKPLKCQMCMKGCVRVDFILSTDRTDFWVGMSSGQAQAQSGLARALVEPFLGFGPLWAWAESFWSRPGPVFEFENWRGPLAQIVAHGPNFSKNFQRILKNFTSYASKLITYIRFLSKSCEIHHIELFWIEILKKK